ncbi:MAG TPA: N-acetyltransferase [Hyphomicrobium sp.]|nr:N-acetyltransferase [Hyphomicrobium sp.]
MQKAEASYARLLAQRAKASTEAKEAERRLTALVDEEPIAELKTKSQRLYYVHRSILHGDLIYRVFRTERSAVIGDDPIGICEIEKAAEGIYVIRDAEVSRSFQRRGIATAVYDLITADMVKIGALLWPVSPKKMSDAEFKVWWRRSPALVFYYPHRNRLGLRPRPEFEELFDEALNSSVWDRILFTCTALLSRFYRSAGLGGVRR